MSKATSENPKVQDSQEIPEWQLAIQEERRRSDENLKAMEDRHKRDLEKRDRKMETMKRREKGIDQVKKIKVPRSLVIEMIESEAEEGEIFMISAAKHATGSIAIITDKVIQIPGLSARHPEPAILEFVPWLNVVGKDLPYTIGRASLWQIASLLVTEEDLNKYPGGPKDIGTTGSGDYAMTEIRTAWARKFAPGGPLRHQIISIRDPWPRFMEGVKFRQFLDQKYKILWSREDQIQAETKMAQAGDFVSIKRGDQFAESQLAGV